MVTGDLAPGVVSYDDRLPYDTSDHLDMVFTVELGAWSPRSAVYAAAVEAAESTGSRIPSAQQVYAALRARGFTEAKRRGIVGFRDLRVPDRLIGADRPTPAGTASAYKNRGERTHAAREAAFAARLSTRNRRAIDGDPSNPATYRPPLSPWFARPLTPFELKMLKIDLGYRR